MRVISGKWRGRRLVTPPGDATRPTADRTREALFSMLASRIGDFEDIAVADFFAGTGALGIEALSRGAASCVFVEHDKAALTALRTNLEAFGVKPDVRAQGVASLGPSTRAHDLLLFDPPYGSGGAGALLERLTRLGWAAPAAWASVETGKAETVTAGGWVVDVERVHGQAKLTLLRHAEEGDAEPLHRSG